MAITYTSKFSGREIDEKLEQVNSLQEEVNKLKDSTDVVDVVGTYNELEHYDFTTLTINDIIKVLKDETKKNKTTYYRLMDNNPDTPIDDGVWEYVGAVDGYLGYENNVDNKITLQSSARVKIGSSDKTKIGYSSTGNIDHYDGDSSGHTDTGRVCWEFEHNKATLRGADNRPVIQLNDNNNYLDVGFTIDDSLSGLKVSSGGGYTSLYLHGDKVFNADSNKTKISTYNYNTGNLHTVFYADTDVNSSGVSISYDSTRILSDSHVDLIPNFSGDISNVNEYIYNRIKIGGDEIVDNSGETEPVIFSYKPARSSDKMVPFAITTDGKAYYQGKELNTGGSEIKIIEVNVSQANTYLDLPQGITYDDFDENVIIHLSGLWGDDIITLDGSTMKINRMDIIDASGSTVNIEIKQFNFTTADTTQYITHMFGVGEINKYLYSYCGSSDYYYTKNETDDMLENKANADDVDDLGQKVEVLESLNTTRTITLDVIESGVECQLPEGITYDDFNKNTIVHLTNSSLLPPDGIHLYGSNMLELMEQDDSNNMWYTKIYTFNFIDTAFVFMVNKESNIYIWESVSLSGGSSSPSESDLYNMITDNSNLISGLDGRVSVLESTVDTKANSSDLNNYYTKSQTENLIAASGGGSGSTKIITITDPGDYEEHELPDGLTYEDFTDGTNIKLIWSLDDGDDSTNITARLFYILKHEATLENADGSIGHKTFRTSNYINLNEYQSKYGSIGMPTLSHVEEGPYIQIKLENGISTFRKIAGNNTKNVNEYMVSEFDNVYELIGTKADVSSTTNIIELDLPEAGGTLTLPDGITYDDFNENTVIKIFVSDDNSYYYLKYAANDLDNSKTYMLSASSYLDLGTTPEIVLNYFCIMINKNSNNCSYIHTYKQLKYEELIDTKIAEYMNANYENGDNGSY